ncbi:hypothetical protein Q2T91_06880 [Ralstonia pseudosolanacearum]|nr:hypothetical protein LGV80_21040 [Ralstonia sp. RS642]
MLAALVVARAVIDTSRVPLVLVMVRCVPLEALVVMRPSAISVRLALPPAVLLMLPLIAMLPSCVPAPVVVMVTLPPLLRRLWMLEVFTSEPLALGVHTLPENAPPVCVPAERVTLYGSSSHRPPVPPPPPPATLTAMPSVSSAWPEVSTWPPLPPCAPPLADSDPCTLATSVPQTISLPPLPCRMALASIAAVGATYVAVALGSGPAPWALPPISAVPPPAMPLTSIRAPSNTPTLVPSTLTLPPLPPPSGALASIWPLTWVRPATGSPISSIVPWLFPTVLARTTPVVLTTDSLRLSSPRAVSTTRPPSATIMPPLLTRVRAAPALMV